MSPGPERRNHPEIVHGTAVVGYDGRYARELVDMWRASFEQAMGTVDPRPVEDQRRYL
jgi:hypothetical protein